MAHSKPNLGRAWRRTFWQVYDNLGLIIAANILWLILAFTILLIPAATASMFYVAYLIVHERSVSIKTFFIGLPKYFLKSTFLLLIICAVFLLLIFNMLFYLQHFGITGIILAGISFWLCVFSATAFLYIYPLLSRDKSLWKILRYSYILVLDNPKVTLQLFICLVILLFLEVILPIIAIGVLAVFLQNSFLEIMSRYNPDIEIAEPHRKFRELWRIWDFS